MTQNTIDLATTTLNLANAPDTAGPGNTGICGGKPPFGKSLQEVMQTTDINNGTVRNDAEQLLPPEGQDLPLQGAYTVGLEGITEVRALAGAISAITRGADHVTQHVGNGFDASGVTAFVAESARGSGAMNDLGGPLGQFDKALVASWPHPAGNADDNNYKIGSFNGTPGFALHEQRITISDAVLIADTTNSKDSGSRSWSLDPGLGLSSMTQSESKFVNRGNTVQASQQPLMTSSSEVVSSNELATHLRVLKSSGGGEARLQLHPAELGRMTVSLIMEGDEARVLFLVDNPHAKHAVETSLPKLRDLMNEAGLYLTEADVSDPNAEENEDQPVERVAEETTTNSGSDAEVLDDITPPTSSQLVDTFA